MSVEYLQHVSARVATGSGQAPENNRVSVRCMVQYRQSTPLDPLTCCLFCAGYQIELFKMLASEVKRSQADAAS